MPSHASQIVAAPTARSAAAKPYAALARRWMILLAPLALTLAVMLLCGTTSLDIWLAGQFYGNAVDPWPRAEAPLLKGLYYWGLAPAWIVGIGALAAFAASVFISALRPYRRAFAFVVICLIVGPGVIVNGVLKPMWGRPRPYQIAEFGGKQAFHQVALPGSFVRGKSFPSGHAAMGFYLLVPALLAVRWGRGAGMPAAGCVPFLWPEDKRQGRRRRRMWIAAWLAAGSTLGLAMSLGRMAQGGHFASDVVGSAACVYGAALLMAPWLLVSRAKRTSDAGARLPGENRAARYDSIASTRRAA